MTDNFDIIKPILKFENPGDFYFLQILLRKKDGNNVPNGSDNQRRDIKDFYITSTDCLDRIKAEVVALCNENNARAYIRLNKRNYRTVSIAIACDIMENVRIGMEFRNPISTLNSMIGKNPERDGRTWIVDVDDHSPDSEKVRKLKEIISRCEPLDVEKVVAVIPTRSGTHLIARPFNVQKFNKFLKDEISDESEVAVLKDNPTILYCP